MQNAHNLAPVPQPPVRRGIWLLRTLVFLGFGSLVFYLGWWLQDGRIISPWLLVGLVLAIIFCLAQLVGSWLLYLSVWRPPKPPRPPDAPTVDVFVTAYKEPYALIEQTLSAACQMRGTHRTWLLDDGLDPRMAEIAARLGAGYLIRKDRKFAKAGNINAALAQTDGEIIVIFDSDHCPRPDFLEKTLGYFVDPQVGFVQVMLTFQNAKQSWVARAAAETGLDFYNPISLGANRRGGATLVGSNALIRRSALESIGGYQPGLAEDLATSIALHAAGWRSVYVLKPLAPGLAPHDLVAWFTQQLKWARGVFELLLTAYPRLFAQLTWGQRLSYMVRMTYYWVGAIVIIHLAITLFVLIFGSPADRQSFQWYLVHLFPLCVCVLLIRQVAMRQARHVSVSNTPQWRALALVYATSPIYVVAWLMAIVRVPLGFRPTPKTSAGGLNPLWLLPQILAAALLATGVLYALIYNGQYDSPLLLAFAMVQAVPLVMLVLQWLPMRSSASTQAEYVEQ